MLKNKQLLKNLIFSFPILFTAVIIWIRVVHYPIYEIIGLEDHIIEYSQFFFFLTSSILAFLIALKFRKILKPMFFTFLLASLALLFVAGEEISWGERLFSIEAHEIFDGTTKIPVLKYNVQGEMNIHNFKPINKIVGYLYLISGTYFIFAYPISKILEKKDLLKDKLKKNISFLTPQPFLILYFIPVYINLFDTQKYGFPPQDYEMVEFLYSLGILIFLIICYLRFRNYKIV